MTKFNIIRLVDLNEATRAKIMPELDALFFEASNTRDFTSPSDKAEFRETWLGRYIAAYPDYFFLAQSGNGALLGYLAGATDNPATSDLFKDIEYLPLFKEFTSRYPAQFHINISPDARGSGVGGALVEAYTTQLHDEDIIGCHVITRLGADNIGFYQACGFREITRARWEQGDRTLVFLGHSFNGRE